MEVFWIKYSTKKENKKKLKKENQNKGQEKDQKSEKKLNQENSMKDCEIENLLAKGNVVFTISEDKERSSNEHRDKAYSFPFLFSTFLITASFWNYLFILTIFSLVINLLLYRSFSHLPFLYT